MAIEIGIMATSLEALAIIVIVQFRSTAVIENFNDCLLMYCSKRFSYQYPAYKARCLLAAIDYSYHKDRPLLFSKDGRPR